MIILEARDIHKSWRQGGFFGRGRRREVLRGVDLTLSKGESVALLGASGGGKSTLGRILLGLERPDAGQVRLKGVDLHAKTALPPSRRIARRRMTQVVFQDAAGSLNPRRTVLQTLAEPLRNFEALTGPALEARARELLEQVHLSAALLGRPPHALSGGQQQRVCLARALAARPEALILDEALSGLDMLAQAGMVELLEALRRDTGLACLWITHDLRLAARATHPAGRMLLLHEGRLQPVSSRDLAGPPERAPEALQPLLAGLLPACPPIRPAAG